MMQKLAKFGAVALAASPVLLFAQDGGVGVRAEELIETAQEIVNSLVPLFMTLALVYFIWGLIKYIRAAGDPEAAKEGRSIMIWGVVALFVMASVWGLTSALQDIFGVGDGIAPVSDDLIPQ